MGLKETVGKASCSTQKGNFIGKKAFCSKVKAKEAGKHPRAGANATVPVSQAMRKR